MRREGKEEWKGQVKVRGRERAGVVGEGLRVGRVVVGSAGQGQERKKERATKSRKLEGEKQWCLQDRDKKGWGGSRGMRDGGDIRGRQTGTVRVREDEG